MVPQGILRQAGANVIRVFSNCKALSSGRGHTNNLKDVLFHWKSKFRSQKIIEPEASATFIIAHVLGYKTLHGVDRSTLLTDSQVQDVNRLCHLRLARMPVQYVLGEWDFHDLTLKLRPPVLIPRPESEELASLCMNTLTKKECVQDEKFLEIGVGSGALTLTLLRKYQQIHAVALDISPDACNLALENAKLVGVTERLKVIEGDFNDEKVLDHLAQLGPYSLIVSNPPYITTEEMKGLQPEIYGYEDHRALHGGTDGLNLIKPILLKSPQLLQRGGHLWLEVASQHPPVITQLLKEFGLHEILSLEETVKDVFGKPRFCHFQYH